jgi:hypothetical protein
MSFSHNCKWCRKHFTSPKPQAVFCGGACRVKSHRILKDFKEFDMWVDEETVKAKYYVRQPEVCTLYLQWFRVKQGDGSYKRYADVYISKSCTTQMEKKMKRKKLEFGLRYT